MKQTLLFTVLFFSIMTGGIQAQDSNSFKFDKSRLELGGNFGLSFGDSKISGKSTALNISPKIGYRFSNYFSAGVGLGYIYRDYSKIDFSENYAGLSLYGRFRPIKYIVLLAEPELYRTWGKNFDSRFVPALLLGGGVTLPVGNSGGITITLSYDVLQNDYSPYYDQLVYSIGYVFGF